MGPDAVTRTSRAGAAAPTEERQLVLEQPDLSTSTIVGDIRPALSGTPEREFSDTLHVGQGGREGNARWTLQREGDSTGDFRFRQKPGVAGKRFDVLFYDDKTTALPAGPKLRELPDGRLLLLYGLQSAPFHSLDVSTGWSTAWRYALLDPETDTWSTPAATSGLGAWGYTGTEIDTGPYWTDWDFAVYPDTGEIVAVVVGGYVSVSNPHRPILATYVSTDDGATWVQRSRVFSAGAASLAFSATGEEFLAVACELTETGRLVVLTANNDDLYALTSDDRGRTWTLTELASGYLTTYESGDDEATQGANRQAITMRRMRNGTILAYHAINAVLSGSPDPSVTYFRMTVDGATWSEVQHDSDPYQAWMSVGVVERPDGYPWIYGTVHDSFPSTWPTGSATIFDEITQLAIWKRDPTMASDLDDLAPSGASTNVHRIHCLVDAGNNGAARPNSPSGQFNEVDSAPVIDGFAQLGVVKYRGQVVIACTMLDEANTQIALGIYRLDFLQPMQELLPPKSDLIGSITRVFAGYHRTWDCYDEPANWGWTLVSSGGTGAISAPNAEGGFFATAASGVQRYWSDTTLPWNVATTKTFTGLIRAVLRVNSGGSTSTPDVALLMVLGDGTNYAGALVKFEVSGTDLLAQLADAHGADIGAGATITDGAGEWIEVLLGQWELTGGGGIAVEAFWRVYDRDADPDWLVGYTSIGSGTLSTTGASSERASFGHISSSSTGTADWKQLAIWRNGSGSATAPTTVDYSLLRQRAATYVDEESDSVRLDRAEYAEANDAGVYNFLRPPQCIAYPAQFVADGVYVSWRGEALASGSISYVSRYLYAIGKALDLSTPQSGWRSASNGEAIEIVLDAELALGSGAEWDVTALAMIGRNFPAVTIEGNATDSWGSPLWSLAAGVPGLTHVRNTALLDLVHSPPTNEIAVGPWRALVTTSSASLRDYQYMRPHRFASKPGGPSYYAVFTNLVLTGKEHSVFRIRDNSRDTLFFYTDPVAFGVPESPSRIAIFSDRMAWDFRDALSLLHPAAYRTRFLRLLIPACYHADDDEQFQAIGTMLLGRATKLGPGIEYGYGESMAPGRELVTTPTGASYSTRRHTPIRTWALDAPVLRPGAVPDALTGADINEARASWQQIVDLMRRLEPDGEPAALAFDGIRLESDRNAGGEQLLSDPFDLALVRIADAGEIQHFGYQGRSIPELGQSGGLHCVPRPVSGVRRIALTEVL